MVHITFPEGASPDFKMLKPLIAKYGLEWRDEDNCWTNTGTMDTIIADTPAKRLVFNETDTAEQPINIILKSVDDNFLEEAKAVLLAMGGSLNGVHNPYEAMIKKGKDQRKNGQIDESIRTFNDILAGAPDNVDARFELGYSLCDKDQWPKAAEEFKHVIKLKPTHANAHNNLGTCYGNLDMQEDAIKEFREAIRLNPDKMDFHKNLAYALKDTGQLGESIKKYKDAVRLGPDNSLLHVDLAEALKDAGELDEAIKEYEEAARLDPDNSILHVYLAEALFKHARNKLSDGDEKYYVLPEEERSMSEEEYEAVMLECDGLLIRSKNEYEFALIVDQNKLSARVGLGNLCIYMSRTHGERAQREMSIALGEYRRKRIENGEDPRTPIRDEEYYALEKKLDDKYPWGPLGDVGLNHLRQASEKYPDFGYVHALLAKYTMDINEAIEAVRLDPKYKYAYDNVLGEFEEAWLDPEGEVGYELSSIESPLLEAIEKSPGNPALHFLLAEQYSLFGGEELLLKAAYEYNQAILCDPSCIPYRRGAASCYDRLNLYSEAIIEYKEIIRLDPDEAVNYYELGCLYSTIQSNVEAIESLRQAIKLDPGQYSYHKKLSDVYVQTRNYDEAIRELTTVLSLRSRFAGAHVILSDIMMEKGLVDEAINELKEAIVANPDYATPHYKLGQLLELKYRSNPGITLNDELLDEIASEYEQAVKLTPSDPDYPVPEQATYLSSLAGILIERGQVDDAIEKLEEAASIDPENPDYHNRLGRALKRNGNIADAIAEYQEAIRLDSKNAYYHVSLANLYKTEGRFEEARREYHETLVAEPLNEVCRSYVERAMKELKKKEAPPYNMPLIYPTIEDEEIWRLNRETELKLREFVRNKLIEAFGESWVERIQMDQNVKALLEVYKARRRKDATYSNALKGMGVKELFKIILSQWNVFEPVFGNDTQYWKNTYQFLSWCARNPYGHNDTDDLMDYEKLEAMSYYREILYKINAKP